MFTDSHAREVSGGGGSRTSSMMGLQVTHLHFKIDSCIPTHFTNIDHDASQAFLCDFSQALAVIPLAASSSCAHVDMHALYQHLCGKDVAGNNQPTKLFVLCFATSTPLLSHLAWYATLGRHSPPLHFGYCNGH
jgi:hypothetical protein